MGRALGALYTSGALLTVVWVALPHAPGARDAVVLLMAGLALVSGLVMFAGAADSWPRTRFHVAIALIQVAITVGYVAADEPSNDIRLFYLWATPYAVFFFSLRAAAWHTAWVAVCMATGLVLLHPEPAAGASVLLMTLGAVAAVWSIVSWATRVMRRSQRQLHTAATHDPLTGLPNRTLFLERSTQALERRRGDGRVFVLLIDLDRFKVVNDTRGHHTGDALLVGVAARMLAATRTHDTVARLGGDEFAVLVDDPDQEVDPTAVAGRIAAALADPVRTGDALVYTSGGIGVAVSRAAGDTALSLLRDADAAMYRAKAAGPGSIALFDQTMRAGARERAVMENLLRTAPERGELSLAYQPIVDLTSGRASAAEALLRWDSPELGSVGPDVFIPMAEELGTIVDIGDWVLDQAAAQLQAWRDDDVVRPGFRIGVNVSVAELSTGFDERVRRSLDDHGLIPTDLTIEITESALIERGQPSAEVVEALHQLGVLLVLDDFGTGYASLSSLQRLPLNALKIDRSFVSRLPGSSADTDIVRAIITMASAFGHGVVAEGVETVAQARCVRDLGCRYAQGFLFARPVAAGDFPACLDRLGVQGAIEEAGADGLTIDMTRSRSMPAVWPGTRDRTGEPRGSR